MDANELDLAIPQRSVYSGLCSVWDHKTRTRRGGRRRFRKFAKKLDGSYVEKKGHVAMTYPTLKGDTFYVECSCGEFNTKGEADEVLSEFAEHSKKTVPVKFIPGDEFFCPEEEAHLVTSFVMEEDGIRYHAPAIDIDHPVSIRESSPGKFHLFIDQLMPEDEYMDLLDSMARVGIVERGYAEVSKLSRCSSLRLPDIPKVADPAQADYSKEIAKRVSRRDGAIQASKDAIGNLLKDVDDSDRFDF